MNFNAFSSHFYFAKFPNALMSMYTPVISTAMMIIFSRLLGLLNSLIYSDSPKNIQAPIFVLIGPQKKPSFLQILPFI